MAEPGTQNLKFSENKISGYSEVTTTTSNQEPKEVFNYNKFYRDVSVYVGVRSV